MRRRLLEIAFVTGILAAAALGGYEVTAKSPRLLGQPLPGWARTVRVEHRIRWTRPTRIFPVDKLLHETREAWLYYGMMSGLEPVTPRFGTAPLSHASGASAISPRDPVPAPGRPRTASRG